MSKQIYQSRKATGLTQVELAAAAECGLATIQRHEKASTWPRSPRLKRRITAALAAAKAKLVAEAVAP